jgi:hypothetical protein
MKGDYFQFGSVFIKKKPNQNFLKKNKPKPVQTDRFWFDSVWFFGQKPVWFGFFTVFLVLDL